VIGSARLWRSEALTAVVSKLLRPFQQLRQLGDTGRDLASLVFAHEVAR
jgi:hypothetical protein